MNEFLSSFQKLEFDKIKKYILRYAVSDLGREHIDALFPSSDLMNIRSELQTVTEMKTLLIGDDPLPIENIHDVRKSLQRSAIDNFILAADELQKINFLLKTSRLVVTYFNRRKQVYPLLSLQVITITSHKVLEYNIERAIDEEGRVKDSASKELAGIRHRIVESNKHLKQNLEHILKVVIGKEWVQEEIITTREGRMVIPIKVEHKGKVPGFIHSVSSSGATVYVEPSETLELNNEIRSLIVAEQQEVEKILKELTAQVRDVKDAIVENLRVLANLDFIQAKAKYSIEMIGAEPQLNLSGTFLLRDAYHPILLHRLSRKDVVPLNFELPDDLRTIIITGPNAGGKSVTLKTVGLMAILAQSGCHIPASPESELRIFSRLFVDIGDEQSVENDLSSFSSHLSNIKVILENADDTSLVLIDEIGSGTDPSEGASLAAACLETLTAVGSLNVATTHHGMLKSFAFESAHMQNAAMEFDQKTLKPTYRFCLGIPGSSYAFEMAERLNLPHQIIERSRTINGSESVKLENLILDLEKKSQELKINLDRVEKEKNNLDALNLNYKTKITALEAEVKTIKLRALDEAQNIVDKANAIIESSVKEIREKSGDRQVIKKSKEEVRKVSEEFAKLSFELHTPLAHHSYKVGDSVLIRKSKTRGEISSIIDDRNYWILVGGLRVKVQNKDLEPTEHRKENLFAGQPANQEQQVEINREIDLRGMYGDEAIDAVDKFLDAAILHGLNRVDIIHGKGTGALRKKITEYLKSHRSVKSFRLGEWNEGGSGVTVVELK
jgi:DNA mismatch repair protein MutS2